MSQNDVFCARIGQIPRYFQRSVTPCCIECFRQLVHGLWSTPRVESRYSIHFSSSCVFAAHLLLICLSPAARLLLVCWSISKNRNEQQTYIFWQKRILLIELIIKHVLLAWIAPFITVYEQSECVAQMTILYAKAVTFLTKIDLSQRQVVRFRSLIAFLIVPEDALSNGAIGNDRRWIKMLRRSASKWVLVRFSCAENSARNEPKKSREQKTDYRIEICALRTMKSMCGTPPTLK